MPDESAADGGESSGDDVSQLRDIVAKQHSRINHLEQQVAALDEEPTIGRRGVVGTIAAAVGLGGLAGYGSQHASAQASGPGGQQGTPEEPNDMFAWDLDVQNGATFNGNPLTGVGALDVGELTIGNSPVVHSAEGWEWGFDGADADARLDTALSVLDAGDRIILEKADYTDDRTGTNSIDHRGTIEGVYPNPQATEGTRIVSDWELDSETVLTDVTIRGPEDSPPTVTANASRTVFRNIGIQFDGGSPEILINNDRCLVATVTGGGADITFASGTSDGVAGIITAAVTVTDNGTNQVL